MMPQTVFSVEVELTASSTVVRETGSADKLARTPAATAQNATEPTAMAAAFPPMIWRMEVMETLWIPGPAIRNSRAAPGENPLRRSARATGTEALEQT